MKEQTWTEEHILASDLWGVEKVLEPMSDQEQLAAWRQAVSVLGDLGKLGETLGNDPLLLALTDAMVRVRRSWRGRRTRSRGREEKRLRGMLERSNVLGHAHTAVSDAEWGYADIRAAALEILEEMRKEADEEFSRYKQELGVSD